MLPRPPLQLLHCCVRSSVFFAAALLLILLTTIFYYNFTNQLLFSSRSKWLSSTPMFNMDDILEGTATTIVQDDYRLVEYVGTTGVIQPPPAPTTAGYNLKNPDKDPSFGQSKAVLKILKNMTGGFFIECGALDGETRSNTLYMEKELGWSGLLVEADPSNFQLLLEKRRRAYAANVCLATKRHPHEVMFRQAYNLGKIVSDTSQNSRSFGGKHKVTRVQCIPIYTLLLALNVTTVDYFSLDVEGKEFDVLKTIPFDKLMVRVLSVEYAHDKVPGVAIIGYMARFGYRMETEVRDKSGMGWAHDYIFVHKSIL